MATSNQQSKPKRPDRYAKSSGNQPNEERRVAVKALYDAGLSIRAISERIGVTFQAVHSMLQRMGVTMRPRGASTGGHSRHKK
jgi:transposase